MGLWPGCAGRGPDVTLYERHRMFGLEAGRGTDALEPKFHGSAGCPGGRCQMSGSCSTTNVALLLLSASRGARCPAAVAFQ